MTVIEDGYWLCPRCGQRDGEHAVDCTVTDDSDLEWVTDAEGEK